MICPKFKVHQDDDYVIITIDAPHANIKDTEVVYYEQTFLFVSNPYFLRLFLPKPVIENEISVSDINMEDGKTLFTYYNVKDKVK